MHCSFENPKVQEEMFKILKFWLDIGVDGFRVDAVPYLCMASLGEPIIQILTSLGYSRRGRNQLRESPTDSCVPQADARVAR